MVTVRVEGRSRVAALLRAVADGMESGTVRVGGQQIVCPEEVAAVVHVPEESHDQQLLVNLRFEMPATGGRHVAVEGELLRPGG